MLIDPCITDPAKVIVHHRNGRLVSSDRRGLTTINLFNLNRADLVMRRRTVVDQMEEEWKDLVGGTVDMTALTDWLSHHTSANRSFCGQRRQILTLWASEESEEIDGAMSQIAPVAEVTPWTVDAVRQAEEEYEQISRRSETYSLRSRGDTPREGRLARGIRAVASVVNNLVIDGYFDRSHTITMVELKNVRSFEFIRFQIPRADDLRAPWTMFLGENATGKSTILQAVAACLAGADQARALNFRPADFLREGAHTGYIRVHLSGRSEPLEVTLRRGNKRLHYNDPEPKVLVLGYGATRLLPRQNQKSNHSRDTHSRVENLFDPFSPTIDAGDWLLDQTEERFQLIGLALEQALDLPHEAFFVRDSDAETVSLTAFGSTVPLRQLSDGYQSIIGTVIDIISVLLNRWKSIDVAEGIVLIDELGSHLHPQWKTRIVHGLRSALPRVQFLVSTHDPLCVHGVDGREIVILERRGDGTITTTNTIEGIDEMTIDQVLQTQLFNLPTTRGMTAVRNFERGEELLRRRATGNLTPDESIELPVLLDRLGSPPYLRSTGTEAVTSSEIEQWAVTSSPAIDMILAFDEEEEE